MGLCSQQWMDITKLLDININQSNTLRKWHCKSIIRQQDWYEAVLKHYRGGEQKTSLDFRLVLRAYLSVRAEIQRSPSVCTGWLFMMVARCLQWLSLVKRLTLLNALTIFRDNLACVSIAFDSLNLEHYTMTMSHCISDALSSLIEFPILRNSFSGTTIIY